MCRARFPILLLHVFFLLIPGACKTSAEVADVLDSFISGGRETRALASRDCARFSAYDHFPTEEASFHS